MGCFIVLGIMGLSIWWLLVLALEINDPTFFNLRFIFFQDTVALGLIALRISAALKPGKKIRAVGFGLSWFFFALVFIKSEWLLAVLKILGTPEAAALIWLKRPSAFLLAAALIITVSLLFQSGPQTLKRGVEIRPLKIYEGEQEIRVGAFAPWILPADVRRFSDAKEGAKISLPMELITRGISILGDPGSGKSRLMRLLHDGIHTHVPDIPVLIHDPKGEWLRTYYDPATDLIFAPYDKRGVNWDILSDIKTNPQLLSSIVATAVSQHHGGGESVYWISSASAIIQEQLETSNDLMSFRDGLLKWRESRGNDKTALSAYSSARPAIKDIATIALTGGADKRTMEQFLNHRGRIFLLNSPTQATEQSGAFAIFISAFVLSCLSRSDTSKPRAVAIIDEALTFHLPPVVEQSIAAQSRSKGLITIAAAQWLPKDERRLLTRAEFIFGMKVGDIETGKKLAAMAGHAVYDEEVRTTTSGQASSTSSSRQERSRQMVPPEYFRSLPERSFILLHQAGFAPGITAEIKGEQQDHIAAFEYQQQPLISEYMKVL